MQIWCLSDAALHHWGSWVLFVKANYSHKAKDPFLLQLTIWSSNITSAINCPNTWMGWPILIFSFNDPTNTRKIDLLYTVSEWGWQRLPVNSLHLYFKIHAEWTLASDCIVPLLLLLPLPNEHSQGWLFVHVSSRPLTFVCVYYIYYIYCP